MQGWCSSLPFIEETDLLRASHLLGHGLQPNLGQARGYYRGDLVSEFKGMSDDTESREELDLATSQDLLTRCAVVWCGVVCCGVLWCAVVFSVVLCPPPPPSACAPDSRVPAAYYWCLTCVFGLVLVGGILTFVFLVRDRSGHKWCYMCPGTWH